MKTFKLITLALLMSSGLVLAQAGFVLAHGDGEKHEESIKMLRDASAALAQSNPELSAKLSADADRKEQWKEKNKDMKKKHEEDIQTFKDASAALAQTNPELSAKLNTIAERKAEWKEKHKKGENAENETK